jgi:tRNA U34 2-thiouridine synthase MnmA/TrmU
MKNQISKIKNTKSTPTPLLQKEGRALVLFSGGLDSMLAAKILQEQGIEVELICFYTDFYGCGQARESAKIINLPLREIDLRKDFLAVLKNPKHGYGAALNPCIDCHALMLKKAGEIMKEEGFDFVATGEVLGERPMSQNKNALSVVEKDSGLCGYLLRPLSAKLLEPTIPEKEGLVDRGKLMDIFGRSRQGQMKLAKKYGIEKYPTPAGGCSLTQSGFAERLKKIMEAKADFGVGDGVLAGIGRHFFENGSWIILGRNEEENEFLKKTARTGDFFVEFTDIPGPSALVRGVISEGIKNRVKDLLIEFSAKAKGENREEIIFEERKLFQNQN